MPYVDTEWAVVAEGGLPNSEVWANRWTVQENTVSPDPALLEDAFHAFYSAWAGLCANEWSYQMLSFRNLVNGTVVTPTMTAVAGQDVTGSPLPPTTSVRVSLSAAGGRRGGPFLCGMSTTILDSTGQADATELAAIATALEALFTDADTAGYDLRLDSPTDTGTLAITACRLGRTIDVIRKRRNSISESYINVPVP